jgi:methionyl-tRNA synthetase
MPSTATSIVEQLNAPLLSISDKWSGDSLKGGHKIGKAAYLFLKIDDKKVEEWKTKFGGTQASRLAEEEAKAKKKAEKEREKERKKAKKAAAAAGQSPGALAGEVSNATFKEKREGKAAEEKKFPFRNKVAEEQAPPPAAAP